MSEPRQGEIWWAEADDKRRPVLIVTPIARRFIRSRAGALGPERRRAICDALAALADCSCGPARAAR